MPVTSKITSKLNPYTNARAISVEPKLWAKFKARAKKNSMTVSALNTILIRDFLSSDKTVRLDIEVK